MEPSVTGSSSHTVESPYACWCLWHAPGLIVYVYGHTLHCREIVSHIHPSRCIAKGFYRTPEDARRSADEAANAWRALGPAYAGTRALSTAAYLAEFPDPGLLCEPIESPATVDPPA